MFYQFWFNNEHADPRAFVFYNDMKSNNKPESNFSVPVKIAVLIDGGFFILSAVKPTGL
jgi:hypothetical protein